MRMMDERFLCARRGVFLASLLLAWSLCVADQADIALSPPVVNEAGPEAPIEPRVVPDAALAKEAETEAVAQAQNATILERWSYWSNEDLEEFVHRMEREHPKYCRAFEVGESVDGAKIWSLIASKTEGAFPEWPSTSPSSLVPSFLYIGNIHGAEPLGRQLMMYLAEELCIGAESSATQSSADPAINDILEHGAVHLLFAINPDGFARKQRYNANNKDLNRNFPQARLGNKDLFLTGEEEKETTALINYVNLLGRSLVGLTTFHEGAQVVSYPFDGNRDGTSGTYNRGAYPSPDDKLFRYLGKQYASKHQVMRSNDGGGAHGIDYFENGLVQGSAWYPVYGSLQDYFYLKNNVYATTIEMENSMWAPATELLSSRAAELPRLWLEHRPSMYSFLRAYLCQGITVQVDAAPDAVEEEVAVTMLNCEMGRQVKYRGKTTEGVHYPVPPGTYFLRVEWESGASVIVSGVVVDYERTTIKVQKPRPYGAQVVDPVWDPSVWKDTTGLHPFFPEAVACLPEERLAQITYWSNDQINAFVQKMQREHPQYCRALQIGESVDGTQIWSLTASKTEGAFPEWPSTSPSSLVPSFLYIGNIHGNEPLGRQLMMYLAEELCIGARSSADPAINDILEHGAVHLLFAINPDGFARKQRYNANNKDLNRNFPHPFHGNKDLFLTGEEEKETTALINYVNLLGRSLVGLTTLHEGAQGVAVPYDGNKHGSRKKEPNPTHDDKLFWYLAEQYASKHQVMRNTTGGGKYAGKNIFQNGIVQGSDWYPLYGSVQDYVYLKNNVYATTIEMENVKWIQDADLKRKWLEHRPSMYSFLRAYLCQGITVQVDAAPDAVEEEVAVTMLNCEMGRQVKYRGKTTEGVHYPVPPGTYFLRVEWESGASVIVSGVVVDYERTTIKVQKPKEGARRSLLRSAKIGSARIVSALNETEPTLPPIVPDDENLAAENSTDGNQIEAEVLDLSVDFYLNDSFVWRNTTGMVLQIPEEVSCLIERPPPHEMSAEWWNATESDKQPVLEETGKVDPAKATVEEAPAPEETGKVNTAISPVKKEGPRQEEIASKKGKKKAKENEATRKATKKAAKQIAQKMKKFTRRAPPALPPPSTRRDRATEPVKKEKKKSKKAGKAESIGVKREPPLVTLSKDNPPQPEPVLLPYVRILSTLFVLFFVVLFCLRRKFPSRKKAVLRGGGQKIQRKMRALRQML